MPLEYQMLTLMTIFFIFAWIPASIAKYYSFGPKWLASNRGQLPNKELPAWGQRAERAHNNLKDYFPGFIVAIILLGILNKFDTTTYWCSIIFVLSRVTHLFSYVAGNVSLRALSFTTGILSNLILLIKIF